MSSVLNSSENYIWNTGERLGHGATCDVFKAYNRRTGEPAAVKVFNRSGYARDMVQQERELTLAQNLEHRNLVKVFGIEHIQTQATARVVIMELCEGDSLFNFLILPQNYYGLADKEFLTVLNDVTAGVKYLREQQVVHRDIKPGNIMRCLKEDGSSLYKLTDLGGARELADDQSFMSLHGTPEYLHPDMYNKALVDKRAPANFTAEVDLWSLGATFYHCATSRTPFKPKLGRNDHATMLKMTSCKESGVISGVQTEKDGPITYSKELPSRAPLSKSLKRLITPVLAKLLERDDSKALKYDEFFSVIEGICGLKCISLFDAPSCTNHKLYLSKTCTFQEFQAMVAKETGIVPSNQLILSERYCDMQTLEKNFLNHDELYVLTRESKEVDTTYTAHLQMSPTSTKPTSDIITRDLNLAYWYSIDVHQFSGHLKRCLDHVTLVSHVMASVTDYSTFAPSTLRQKITELGARYASLETRQKDILETNDMCLAFVSLLIDLFNGVEQERGRKVSSVPHALKTLQGILTSNEMSTICNRLQKPCIPGEFGSFYSVIKDCTLKSFITAFLPIERVAEAMHEVLLSCAPIPYTQCLLEARKNKLVQWAAQKEKSVRCISDQLQSLDIKNSELRSTRESTMAVEHLAKLEQMSGTMRKVIQDAKSIYTQFEQDKKRAKQIKQTTAFSQMHQLNRMYLDTLRVKGNDVASAAVKLCNEVNLTLKPRIEEYFSIQASLGNHQKEYESDLSMLEQQEENQILWRDQIFHQTQDIPRIIKEVTLPVLKATETSRMLHEQVKQLEALNKSNLEKLAESQNLARAICKEWECRRSR